MTAPIATGYSDWKRTSSRAVKLFVNLENEGAAAAETQGPFYVGDIPYIAYIFDTSLNPATFSAEYYLDKAMTVFLGDQTLDAPVNGGFDISLPVQGPWVLFRITPVGGGISYDLKAYEVAGPLANLRGNAVNNILLAANSNIGAGASLTTSAARVWPGEAHWFTESAVATWTSRLEAVEANGTTTIIDEFRKTAAGDAGRQVFLPSCMVQIVTTNQSGGAGTFRLGLVARPVEAGR